MSRKMTFDIFLEAFKGSTRRGKAVPMAELHAMFDRWMADNHCVICEEIDVDCIKGIMQVAPEQGQAFGAPEGLQRRVFYSVCQECAPKGAETWDELAEEIQQILRGQATSFIPSQSLVDA